MDLMSRISGIFIGLLFNKSCKHLFPPQVKDFSGVELMPAASERPPKVAPHPFMQLFTNVGRFTSFEINHSTLPGHWSSPHSQGAQQQAEEGVGGGERPRRE